MKKSQAWTKFGSARLTSVELNGLHGLNGGQLSNPNAGLRVLRTSCNFSEHRFEKLQLVPLEFDL